MSLLRREAHHVSILIVLIMRVAVDWILLVLMRGLHRKLRAVKKVRVVAGRAARVVLALESDGVGGVSAEEVLQGHQTRDRWRLWSRGHVMNVGRQD